MFDVAGLDPASRIGGSVHFFWVEPFVYETHLHGKVIGPSDGLSWDDRLLMGREEVVGILREIWPYLLVGIGLGAAIHGWLPAEWFARHATAQYSEEYTHGGIRCIICRAPRGSPRTERTRHGNRDQGRRPGQLPA